ncbi:MAG: MFS transporter, partial [Gammaproteobacteria bacterium]|nr:MFS transporter [Gammaproteobacteria bacterium]
LSTCALIFLPNSTSLFMAAVLLWVLDGSVNIAMQPYRALIADVAPANQQTKGFAIQTCMIGIGGTLASALPWLMLHFFHVHDIPTEHIPLTLRLSFYIGAAFFILANLWTIFNSKEYPPEDMQLWQKKHQKPLIQKIIDLRLIFIDLLHMPKIMREISYVQFFTWLGLFCMFLYYGLAVAQNIFGLPPGATVIHNFRYQEMLEHGIAVGGLCFALYTLFSFVYAYLIPFLSRLMSRKYVHIFSLLLGAIGLMSSSYMHTPAHLYIAMIGIGAAWASVSTIPYAMLGNSLPKDKMGVYMGLFNMTICLPEIIAALSLGFIVHHFFHNHAMSIIFLAGVCFIIAAFLTLFINDKENQEITDESVSKN